MKTLELPVNGHTNGHARFHDADFTEAMSRQDLPAGSPVQDPGQDEGPIAPARKKLKSVSFQKLLAEIEQEETQPPRAERPAFPLHTLPPALRTWVEGIASQTQTAPEAAAMLGLATSSAALAGRMTILAPDASWRPANLFVGVLTAGDRCDDVLSSAIAPLRELEFEQLEKAEQQEIEPAPRRILDDVTARSLRYQLSQLGRIACFSPTGDIFRQIAGRTSISRQRLLETLDAGYVGRNFVFDGSRGKQSGVHSPAITLASLVDRSLVSSIGSQRECPARTFLARCLFVSPESRVGSREISPEGLTSENLAGSRTGEATSWRLRKSPWQPKR